MSFSLEKYLPFQGKFLEIDGYRLHYLDEGSGPAVLLLHGNPTWCFYYRNLLADLKSRFRVIVPDYIGCGLSDHPVNVRFRARDRIDHMQRLVDTLGLQKFSLVMHDWGGAIGTGLAVQNVEKVEKLVYLNTTLTETESLPWVIKLSATPLIGRVLTRQTKTFLRLATDIGVVRKLPKEIKAGYMYPYRTRKEREAIWGFVDDIPFDSSYPSYTEMLNLAAKIPELADKPVQIVWGLRDPCFHREMLMKVAAHFPHARVLEIPDASHLVLEDAQQLANQTINNFLSEDHAAIRAPQTLQRGSELRRNALYDCFMRMAEERPQADAVIEHRGFVDPGSFKLTRYEELKQRIHQYERGLYELGLRRGHKILMLVQPGAEFLALSYAVMARGGIPVFLDPGMGKENLIRCIEDLKPDGVIGTWKVHLLGFLRKTLFRHAQFKILAHDIMWFWGNDLSFLKRFSSQRLPDIEAPDAAMVAFTSGGTGVPKGVVFTHEMIQAELGIFREQFGLLPGMRDLPLLPIFSLFHAALGVCSVFAPVNPAKPLSLNPAKIVQIVNSLGIESAFGSPTLWNKIYEYCLRSRAVLRPLRKVFMAGAPVDDETLRRVKSILPQGEAFTAFGATEALPVTLASSRDVLEGNRVPAQSGELGAFVGKPLRGVEIKVIAPVAGAIAEIAEIQECAPLQIGELIVRGKNVSTRYLDRPEADRLGKIADGETVWHRMGDMAYLDSEGNIYFCGRKAHVVTVRDQVYHSVPVEDVFNAHQKVKRSALVNLHNGAAPGVVVEPYPQFWPASPEAIEALSREIKDIARTSPLTASIEKVFFHKSLPVDGRHNAKIFRDRLSVWASAQDGAQGGTPKGKH